VPQTLLQRWLYALKLKSWPKLAAPMLLGQGVGVATVGQASFGATMTGIAFTALDLVLIVLLNDWGDREVDAIKRRRFPEGCSPKTIPDGILPASHVLFGGLLASAALVALGFVAGTVLHRPLLFPLSVGTVAMFVAYTFKPVALNYRGGGELVEALGVGLVLPAVSVYLHTGVLFDPLMLSLAPALVTLAAASAVASGLSDEESDREGGKRTFTTMLGNRRARGITEVCVAVGAALLLWSKAPWLVILPSCAVLGFYLRKMRAVGPTATTSAFNAQNDYKGALHAGLWGAQVLLGVTLAALGLLASPTMNVLMLP
jgi:1,4-dihydroxy-2-naphthoate octaprenyltransferase/chlorophyll synthase